MLCQFLFRDNLKLFIIYHGRWHKWTRTSLVIAHARAIYKKFDIYIYMLHARDFLFFSSSFSNAIETPRYSTPRSRNARVLTHSPFLFPTIEQFRISSITFFSVSQSHSVPVSIIFQGIPAHKRPFKLSPVRSRSMKQGGEGRPRTILPFDQYVWKATFNRLHWRSINDSW